MGQIPYSRRVVGRAGLAKAHRRSARPADACPSLLTWISDGARSASRPCWCSPGSRRAVERRSSPPTWPPPLTRRRPGRLLYPPGRARVPVRRSRRRRRRRPRPRPTRPSRLSPQPSGAGWSQSERGIRGARWGALSSELSPSTSSDSTEPSTGGRSWSTRTSRARSSRYSPSCTSPAFLSDEWSRSRITGGTTRQAWRRTTRPRTTAGGRVKPTHPRLTRHMQTDERSTSTRTRIRGWIRAVIVSSPMRDTDLVEPGPA